MQTHIQQHRMAALCQALNVSRSGYYAWKQRPQEASALDQAVAQCHQMHRGRAGAPCLTRDVQALGIEPVNAPWFPVLFAFVSGVDSTAWIDSKHEQKGQLLGQCGGRKLLCYAEKALCSRSNAQHAFRNATSRV
jgi:hypothetical protein